MDIERFEQLAGAFGAARERWPTAEHALYDRCAATPEGTRILVRAAELDALLDDFQPRADDPLRAARVLRAARAASRRELRWVGAACAASAVLGLLLGFSTPGTDEDELLDSGLLYGSAYIEDYL